MSVRHYIYLTLLSFALLGSWARVGLNTPPETGQAQVAPPLAQADSPHTTPPPANDEASHPRAPAHRAPVPENAHAPKVLDGARSPTPPNQTRKMTVHPAHPSDRVRTKDPALHAHFSHTGVGRVSNALAMIVEHEAAATRRAQDWARRTGSPLRREENGTVSALIDYTPETGPLYRTTLNAQAAVATRTDAVRDAPPYSLSGTNITAGIWDGGRVRHTHAEFAGGRVQNFDTVAFNNHATHVAGTMIAGGAAAAALGMAPHAELLAYDFINDLSQMTDRALTDPTDRDGKVQLSNHSYGFLAGWASGSWSGNTGPHWFGTWGETESDSFGRYGETDQLLDALTYEALYYLPIWAAGNDRNDAAPTPGTTFYYQSGGAWLSKAYDPGTDPLDDFQKGGYNTIPHGTLAKNILVVGAIQDAVSGGERDVDAATAAAFSSWGPADDGRIKPDLVAAGVGLYSSGANHDTHYYTSNGTSMAAPNVSGSALLLLELHEQLFPGALLRASSLKGLMLHTADALDGPGPDYRYGWGLLNTRAAADWLQEHARSPTTGQLIEDVILAEDVVREHALHWNEEEPLRATLLWNDPPGPQMTGLNNTNRVLVNDLDLRVIAPDGETEFFPWVLDPTLPDAMATTGDNVRDNVEQVYIGNPPTHGIYTVRVFYKGELTNGQQPFSLLISGAATRYLELTDPDEATVTVAHEVSTIPLQGVRGSGVDATLHWTNTAAAVGGVFTTARTWTLAEVPLVVGLNPVTITGVYTPDDTELSVSLSITRRGFPPTLAPIPPQTVLADATLQYALEASNPENDPMTFSVETDAPAERWTLEETTGAFRYAPLRVDTGVVEFVFTATDVDGSSAPQTMTVTVHATPEFEPVAPPATNTGTLLTFSVTASGDPHPSVTLESTTASAGYAFDPHTGDLTYTPPFDDAGERRFSFIAENAHGTHTLDVLVQVTLIPPAIPEPTLQHVWVYGAELDWEPVNGAEHYRIDLNATADFDGAFVEDFEHKRIGTNTVSISDLTPGTTVYFRVRAENDAGSSESSATVTVTTPDENIIDFPAIAPPLFTHEVTLHATATTLLPVTFEVVEGPAILDHTRLTFTATGSVAVAAYQPGNETWPAAIPVTNHFEVLPAIGTVLLSELEQVYDSTPRLVSASTEPAGLALLVTYDGETHAPVHAGHYTVTGVITEPNWTGTASDTFQVNQAEQSIHFPLPESAYWTNTISLEAVADSGLPVLYEVVSGPAWLSAPDALSFTGTGGATLRATQVGDANWQPASAVTRSIEAVGPEVYGVGTNAVWFASDTIPSLETGTDFGATLLETRDTNRLAFTNTGTADWVVHAVTTSGTHAAWFSLTEAPLLITEGESVAFDAVYAPEESGRHEVAYHFAHNGTGTVFTLHLAGTGMGGSLLLSEESLTFHAVYANANPSAQTNIFTNAGTSFYVFSNAWTYVGTATNWLTIHPDTGTVPAGDTYAVQHHVDVSTLNAGRYDAVVTVQADYATNSPQQYTVTLEIEKAPQSIHFPSIPEQWSTARPELQATADSGLPIAFRIESGPATLSGTRLSFSAPGEVIIVAEQTGNENWWPAEPVTHTFQVVGPLIFAVGADDELLPSETEPSIVAGTDFGDRLVGGTYTRSFQFTNHSAQGWLISPVSITGAGAGAFAVTNVPTELAAGTATTFDIIYTPETSGTQEAAFDFGHDGNGGLFILKVAGTGVGGSVTLSTNQLHFTAEYGDAAPPTATIVYGNPGIAAYHFSNEWVYGEAAADWLNLNPVTGTVEVDDNVPVHYAVHPHSLDVGQYEADVRVQTAFATNALQEVLVTLTVTAATPALITPPAAANIVAGQTLNESALTGGEASVPGEFTWQQPTFVPEPGAGEYTVVFTPTDTWNYTSVSFDVALLVDFARFIYSPTGDVHHDVVSGTSTHWTWTLTNSGTIAGTWSLTESPETFSDALEGGLAAPGWTYYGEQESWHLSTNRAARGDHAWYNGSFGDVGYRAWMNASLELPEVVLQGNQPELTFQHWIHADREGAWSGYSWHGGVVEISVDGGETYTMLTPVGGYPYLALDYDGTLPFSHGTPLFAGDGEDWEQAVFDLTNYAGATARIRFRFGSDSFYNGVPEGWYIDDLRIASDTGASDWLHIAPAEGVLAAGSSETVTGTASAEGLPPGTQRASTLYFQSNDPIEPNRAFTVSMHVPPTPIAITLHPLEQVYDGQPRTVFATTEPPDLDVEITYDGWRTVPVDIGEYAVSARAVDPQWEGEVHDTLRVIPLTHALRIAVSIAPTDDRQLDFGTVLLGEERVEQITIYNTNTTHALQLTNIRLVPQTLHTDTEEEEPQEWSMPPSPPPAVRSSNPLGRATAAEHDPQTFLVQFHPTHDTITTRSDIHREMGTAFRHAYRLLPVDVVRIEPGQSLEATMHAYRARDDVHRVEPNYRVEPLGLLPDDPRFEDMWALRNTGQTGGTPGADVDAPTAWAIETGSTNVLVAVIDTGIDYTHPDLAANMWVNPTPVMNDLHGASWLNGDGTMTSGNPMDGNNHGTHVAGIIGAVGNNAVGVVGMNWHVQLMALKFLPDSGSGTLADAMAALEYAVAHGAHLSNNSWGGGGYSAIFDDLIAAAAASNHLFVAAAGNSGINMDIIPAYPASYTHPNVIAVASSDHHDNRSVHTWSSNYGAQSVHLAAPGSQILNTLRNGGYGALSGTSMAAPHVSGAAALLWARHPDASFSHVRDWLLNGVDPRDQWATLVRTGGRLNAATALHLSDIRFDLLEMPEFPFALEPGESLTIPVRYRPVKEGTHAGRIVIANNDQNEPEAIVELNGKGEPRRFTWTIHSAHGTPDPAPGEHVFAEGLVVTPTLAAPVLENGGTQHVSTGWTLTGHEPASGITNTWSVTVTNTATLVWTWMTNYWLNVQPPTGGTVTPESGWFPNGETVTVTATAARHYTFEKWEGDIDPAQAPLNPIAISLPAPRAIHAVFRALTTANTDTPLHWLAHYVGDDYDDYEAAAELDLSGKGMQLWEEYIAGTDPLNGNNLFRLAITTGNGDTQLTLPTQIGRLYTVYSATTRDLSAWEIVPGQDHLAGTGEPLHLLIPEAIDPHHGIFKIRVRLAE